MKNYTWDNPKVRRALGQILQGAADNGEAIAAGRKLRVSGDSTWNDPQAQASMKSLAESAGNMGQAIAAGRKLRVTGDSPWDNPQAQANLQRLTEAAGNLSESIAAGRKLRITGDSAWDNPQAQVNLQRLSESAGDMGQAIAAGRKLRVAGDSAWNDSGAQANMAALTESAGNLAERVAAGRKLRVTGDSVNEELEARQRLAALSEGSGQTGGVQRLVKNTLNGGELAPELGSRFDQQRYQTGLHTCLNMVPLPQGGVTRRPPFKAIGRAQSDGQARTRLFPFVFSATETRLLEIFARSETTCGLKVWVSPTVAIMTSLTLPWAPAWLDKISFTQSADVIYCAHPSMRPAKLMRYGDNSWVYSEISWLPDIEPPEIVSIEHSSTQGQSGVKVNNSYVATAVDADTGQESAASEPMSHETFPLSSTFYNTITVSEVENASEYRIYKLKGGVYGFIGRITNGLAFEDRNIGADTEDTPPNWKDPFAAAGDYPSLTFLHQQRLGFASSTNRPMTFWLSQAGNYENMSSSIPPDADDAIEATLASGDASRIVWAQSDRTGLAFGTESGEWLLVSSDGAAITPKDLSFQPQTFFGALAGLPVLRAGNALLYIQKGSHAIREFGYSFSEDRYQSNDLTILARHMLRGKSVTSWCWQGEPFGVVWLTLSDGTLAGLTYLREDNVIAWHRHETAGQFLQCVSVPGFGSEDGLVCLTRRYNPTSQSDETFVEYMQDMLGEPQLTGDGPFNAAFTGEVSPCVGEAQLEGGPSFLLIRKINSLAAQVINSYPMKVSVRSQGGAAQERRLGPGGNSLTSQAIWSCPIGAGHRLAPRLTISLTKPGTILGLAITCEAASSLGMGSQG